jgi:hypothetical protein
LIVLRFEFCMSSYTVDVGPRSRAVARFVARVRSEILTALSEERRGSMINQQTVAGRLQKKRSDINRQLVGEAPLTLRSIAELSWALGREINFELRRPVVEPGQNLNVEMTTVGWKQPTVVALSNGATAQSAAKTKDGQS